MAELIMNYWIWGSVGVIIGAVVSIRNLTKNNVVFPNAIIIVTTLTYAGLAGTKFLEVLIDNPRLITHDFLSTLMYWHGDLACQGFIPFAFPIVFIILRIFKLPFWTNAGAIAPGIALGHSISRLGCFFLGCCHGSICSLPWSIYSKRLNANVHPTQIYDLIAELFTFLVLQYLFEKKPDKRSYLLPVYGLFFGFFRFINEFFRGDDPGPEIIPGMRVYQFIAISYILVSISILVVMIWKKRGIVIAISIFVLSAIIMSVPKFPSYAGYYKNSLTANNYLILSRSIFADSLKPFVDYRRSSGYDIDVVYLDKPASVNDIKKIINEKIDESKKYYRFLLLVGDSSGAGDKNRLWDIPTGSKHFSVGNDSRFLFGDSIYGDLDLDGVTDMAVGRLPAREPMELAEYIKKLQKYESRKIDISWFNVNVWSGAYPYSAAMHEIATEFVRKRLPGWLNSFLMSDNINSIYCAEPNDQKKYYVEAIAVPSFASIIASHGLYNRAIISKDYGKEIGLTVSDAKELKGDPIGPLYILACDAGKINTDDNYGESLAEALIWARGGPIGVFAASGVTFNQTNYYTAKQMIDALDDNSLISVGDYVCSIQRRISETGSGSMNEIMSVDDSKVLAERLKKASGGNIDVYYKTPGMLKYDFFQYSYIGDPAVPLRKPHAIKIETQKESTGKIILRGDTPSGATRLYIDRVYRTADKNPSYKDAMSDRNRRFKLANRRPSILVDRHLTKKKWQASVSSQSDNSGKSFIRVFLLGDSISYCAVVDSQL